MTSLNLIDNLELVTERLRFTPLGLDDIDIAIALFTDPAVVKYICDPVPVEYLHEEMPDTVRRAANGAIGIWCIKDLATDKKIGSAYLLPMPIEEDDVDYSKLVMGEMPDGDIEVGYFLTPSAWGRGYATETCKHLLKFAFDNLDIDEIVASVDDGNLSSLKVLRKCGLIDRGRTKCYAEDSLIYKITREEWQLINS